MKQKLSQAKRQRRTEAGLDSRDCCEITALLRYHLANQKNKKSKEIIIKENTR